jgi:hypothetical protein
MAKPNAYQLEQLKGRNPDLYKGVPQESFDKLFPPAPPAAKKRAAPPARPEPTRAAPVVVPEVKPEPIVPDTIIIPKELPANNRTVPGVYNLEDLKTAYIGSRSRDPLGAFVPKQEREATATAEAIMGQALTPGGERPLLDAKGDQTEIAPTGLKGLAQSLGVQRIFTPEQRRASDAQSFAISQRALEIEQKRLDALLRQAATTGSGATPDQIRSLQQLRMNIDSSPELSARRREIETFVAEGGRVIDYMPKDLVPGGAKPYVPLETTKTGLEEDAKRLAVRAATKAGPGGTIVESPLGYTGRLAAAPVSAGVGLAEAAISDKTAAETVPARIREGRAAMGAGYDIGKAASDAVGLAEDDPARQAAQYVGGGAGLILDMMIPIVPGYSTVRGAIGGGLKAATAGRALSITPKYSILNAALRGGAREAIADVPLLGRLSPRLVDDVYSSSIVRFGEDATNRALMKDILKVSGEMDEAGDIAKLVKDDPDVNTPIIEDAMRRAGNGGSAEEFMASAKRLGFDLEEAQIHNRIKSDAGPNLRKSVLDEGLSDDTKLRLGESNAQLSDADLAELYLYLSRSADNGVIDLSSFQGPTVDAINAIRKALPRSKSGAIKKVLGVLDDVGTDALAKHYLYTVGGERLTDALVTPDLIRVSRSAFVPKDKAKEVYTKIGANHLVKDIRPKLIEAINRGETEIRLTPETVDKIISTIGPDTLRGRGLTPEQNSIIREMANLVPERDPETPEAFFQRFAADYTATPNINQDYRLTLSRYNQLVEIIGDDIARNIPGAKTIFEVSDDLSRIGEGTVASINKQRYYNEVLRPKEVAGGTLESTIRVGVNKALREYDLSTSIASKEFVDEVGQKWGSINEDFKTVYRANRSSGLSAPDAWSKSMVENYIRHAADSIVEAKATNNVELIDEILTRNYSQMFDDYFAQLYGGYEGTVDGINTTGRTLWLDGMLVAPFEMRKLTYIASGDTNIQTLKNRFLRSAISGNFGEALVELRNVHAIAQGKPLSAFIPSQKALERLYEAAKLSDSNGILGYLPLRSGGVVQGDRGAFEIWNYARETAPMFLVSDHLKLLSSQYLVRRQSAIVSETYNDWAKIYPELFPTSENLAVRGKQYADVIRSYPEDLYKSFADDFFAQGVRDPAKKEAIDKIYRKLSGSLRGLDPAQYSRLASLGMTNLFEDVSMGFRVITPRRGVPIGSTTDFVQVLMQDVMRKIAGDAEIAKSLYVSQVVDSLTLLSASEEAANVTLKFLDRQRSKLIPKILDSVESKYNGIFDEIFRGGPKVDLDTQLEGVVYDLVDLQKTLGKPEAEAQQAANDLITGLRLHYEAALPSVYRYLFEPSNLKIHRQLSGADDYVKSIYSSLRSETTPLFYDTLKSSIRNAATSNVNIITKGPVEQISTMPLTFGETARAKGALKARSGIEEYTETMTDLRVHSTVRKVPDMPEASDLDEMIKVGLGIVSDIKEANIKAKGTNRLLEVVGDAMGSPSSLLNDGGLLRFAKGGVLGGQLLPNLRYLGTNYLTAPAIVYSTIGGKYAAAAAKASTLLDFDTNSVMKIILGTDSPAPLTPAALTDIIRKGGTEAPRIIVTAPNGKAYTNYDIASLVSNNSVMRSQASAELTKNIVEDIVSWSGVNVGKLTDPTVTNLNNMSKSQYMEAIKKSYLATGGREMNAFQELGQMTDTMFRTSILKKALSEGLSEDQALTLARESLFDYGNLTRIEKEYISKMFWFWTFRRNSYRNVVKSFLTNPTRLKNTYLANGYFEEMDRDNNIATKDYVETRPFIHLVDDKENKQRFGLYGPGIPMLQATSDMIDYISFFPMIFTEDKMSLSEKVSAIPRDMSLGYAAQATPLPQTIIGLGFGVDPTRDGKELGYSIDPRFMWYLTRNDEVFKRFQSLINLEVVPPDSEVAGRGTYQGRQWRIRKGDQASTRNWFAINQALLLVGAQRNLRDFAPLAALIAEDTQDQTAVQLGGDSGNQALINLLYSTGVITPVAAPTYEDQVEYNKRMISAEFREGTYKPPVD